MRNREARLITQGIKGEKSNGIGRRLQSLGKGKGVIGKEFLLRFHGNKKSNLQLLSEKVVFYRFCWKIWTWGLIRCIVKALIYHKTPKTKFGKNFQKKTYDYV